MKTQIIKCLAVGAIAGFVNGFLGTGGGIILLFAGMLSGKKEDRRDGYAETLCVTFILSAVSICAYFAGGAAEPGGALRFCIPAAFGGVAGAYLLDRLPVKVTGKLFAVLVMIAGVIMLIR